MVEDMYGADIRKQLEDARAAALRSGRNGSPESVSVWWEVSCGLVLLAEENCRRHFGEWENSVLVIEFLDIAVFLEGYDHMLDRLYRASQRMSYVISGHPRLKLVLLRFELGLIRRIEAMSGGELGTGDEISSEISLYEYNIAMADKGDFANIRNNGHIKVDPVEWTRKYEEAIDDVDRKIAEILHDCPRGMGFCHAYWNTKAAVLKELGIDWCSPAGLNPGVIFD